MLALFLMSVLAPFTMGVTRPAGLEDVTEVRHWSYPDFTRVVVELTGESTPTVKRLAANPEAGRPERLYLDLPGIWVGRDYSEPIPVGDGLLAGVRLGQNTLQNTRVVIDLERYHHHKLLLLENPHRIVVDVFGRDRKVASPSKREGSDRSRRLPTGLRSVETIVVDAGHGGKDPGALGPGGIREKDVTLRLARKLKARLERKGFDVHLTRDSDTYLSLEERTAFAEGARGDLFVSLHANASRRHSLQGIETYYLDAGYQRHAARVAARENGAPLAKGDALDRTLGSLRVSEASVNSALLATTVHEALLTGVRQHYPGVQDLGVKKGPFYVLFLSNMPSILVEAGFVTHRGEAKRLHKDSYLELLSEEIADGLVRYRDGMISVAYADEVQR